MNVTILASLIRRFLGGLCRLSVFGSRRPGRLRSSSPLGFKLTAGCSFTADMERETPWTRSSTAGTSTWTAGAARVHGSRWRLRRQREHEPRVDEWWWGST